MSEFRFTEHEAREWDAVQRFLKELRKEGLIDG